jgi:hypothetical protein
MECLDSVKNASFFTFFKTKSEFVFFGKDLEKKANSDFVENNVKKLAFFTQSRHSESEFQNPRTIKINAI